MEIFAAGNKYKFLDGKQPMLIEGHYFVFASRWVKSKHEWDKKLRIYNVGPHYEEIKK